MKQISLILLAAIFGLGACKKSQRGPISNSRFNKAYMLVDKFRTFYRNDVQDSVRDDVLVQAGFEDSTQTDDFGDKVGKVLLGDFEVPESPALYGPYTYQKFDLGISEFTNANWTVISKNGANDLVYDDGSLSFYGDTLPRIIDRSQPLTIRINPTIAPNADSVYIDFRNGRDTMVAVSAGDITFSPDFLSAFSANTNWSAHIAILLVNRHDVVLNNRRYTISKTRISEYAVNVR
ncbi:MAG: hypothetical protein BGO69_08770 [Bacteroidetes bacterium 46-16]|nr:MAG: hypothetical protein BGO69_08770 [Bacteroidetes bacterium 46-16]